jgi:hypothetical protein
MGGIGSGGWFRWDTRSTTTGMLQLKISDMVKSGVINPDSWGKGNWQWTCDGERTGWIGYEVDTREPWQPSLRLIYNANDEPYDYTVRLETTQPNYGGIRWWFRCPARGCGRRVAILYGGKIFACRKCHNLAYPCQNEDPHWRMQRRAQKICNSLGDGDTYWATPPKGMHRKTYERKLAQMQMYDQIAEDYMEEHLVGVAARILTTYHR